MVDLKGAYEKNLASDFYSTKASTFNYEQKYQQGKGYYDSKIEDHYLKLVFKQNYIDFDSKVLEIGYFVGRINKKLGSFYKNITVTDVSQHLIESYFGEKFVLNWSDNKGIDHKEKYDFICNIGHQLSFSCDIEKGISFMSSVAKKNAIVFFDIWNAKCPKENLPNYEVQTMSLDEINNMLSKYDLKLITASYGFAFPYQYRVLFHLLTRALGANIGSKIAWLLYRKLTSKFSSNDKGQNIFIVAEKII